MSFDKATLSSLFVNGMPTVSEVIEQEVERLMNERLRITMPATVISVARYESNQVIDVLPSIGVTEDDGETRDAAKIKNVFVRFPDSGGFVETYPIAEGDEVVLFWSHKSLNAYMTGRGDDTYPDATDRWSMNDVYAEVGFGTKTVNQNPSKSNYRFITSSGSYSLVITPSGSVTESCSNKTITASSITENANKTVNGDIRVNGTTSGEVLKADNGYTGTIGIDQAFVVENGIIVGVS